MMRSFFPLRHCYRFSHLGLRKHEAVGYWCKWIVQFNVTVWRPLTLREFTRPLLSGCCYTVRIFRVGVICIETRNWFQFCCLKVEKRIIFLNIMTAIRLEILCRVSFGYILRSKCVRPTSYGNVAYNRWMMISDDHIPSEIPVQIIFLCILYRPVNMYLLLRYKVFGDSIHLRNINKWNAHFLN